MIDFNSHPNLEKKLGLDNEHVIIDKKSYKNIIAILEGNNASIAKCNAFGSYPKD